jgi:hypothetical protein
MLKKITLWILLVGSATSVLGQIRRTELNSVGWFNYFGTIRLTDKFSAHTEFQWRRDEIIQSRKQELTRVGINYQAAPNVQLRAGYAFIETAAYGGIPLEFFGRSFSEHRTYQMATISQSVGSMQLSHRYMLEQRFIGRYSNPILQQEDQFPLSHRVRYMVRAQKSLGKNAPYIAAYNETMVQFGENVGENIFDQNRFALLVGHTFSPTLRIEGGYLNQTLQLGREVLGSNYFQMNHGVIVNSYFTFGRTKK